MKKTIHSIAVALYIIVLIYASYWCFYVSFKNMDDLVEQTTKKK
jgi:hypothetical protein